MEVFDVTENVCLLSG